MARPQVSRLWIAAFVASLAVYSLILALRTLGAVSASQQARFDNLVRADFFAGIQGDQLKFERAMRKCEEALRADPANAEALVWHGAGLVYRAGQAFEAGQPKEAMAAWGAGLSEMDRAVDLAPNNVAVLIPRGATLLETSKQVAVPGDRDTILRKGIGDYEKVLRLQQSYFDSLSTHARGELLFALGDGFHRLGDTDAAAEYFKRVIVDLSGTVYAKRAEEWVNGSPKANPGCQGCH